jgi:hypothetical protein
MTKPDRFERMVARQFARYYPGIEDDWMPTPDTIKLLRREHQATVRAVKKLPRWMLAVPEGEMVSRQNGLYIKITDLLAMLGRRKK